MSNSLWVGRVVEWMQWPAAFPCSMFLQKQGSSTFQTYEDPMDLQFSHLIIPKVNTFQSIFTIRIFVKVS
jgi:hypothetical protein